jgi:hypothetical protein
MWDPWRLMAWYRDSFIFLLYFFAGNVNSVALKYCFVVKMRNFSVLLETGAPDSVLDILLRVYFLYTQLVLEMHTSKSSWGVERDRRVRLTTLQSSVCPFPIKCVKLNLQPYRPPRSATGIVLPLLPARRLTVLNLRLVLGDHLVIYFQRILYFIMFCVNNFSWWFTPSRFKIAAAHCHLFVALEVNCCWYFCSVTDRAEQLQFWIYTSNKPPYCTLPTRTIECSYMLIPEVYSFSVLD